MKKIIFLAGVAVGFVLGSRAGREPYEVLSAKANEFAGDPVVREKAAQARETAGKVVADAKEKAPEVASTVKEKSAAAASSVSAKVSKDSDAEKLAKTTEDTATHGGTGEVSEDKPLGS